MLHNTISGISQSSGKGNNLLARQYKAIEDLRLNNNVVVYRVDNRRVLVVQDDELYVKQG